MPDMRRKQSVRLAWRKQIGGNRRHVGHPGGYALRRPDDAALRGRLRELAGERR